MGIKCADLKNEFLFRVTRKAVKIYVLRHALTCFSSLISPDSHNVFVFIENDVLVVLFSQKYINTSFTTLGKSSSVVDKFISTFNLLV